MATSLDGFAQKLQSAQLGDFEARPYYERKTDSLIYYFIDTRSYSKRVTKYFTVFLSMDDDTLVGFEVKSLTAIMRAIENLGSVDLVDPVAVKDTDGDGVSLRVVVHCAALVPEPEEPVTGKDFEELQSRTKGITISRRDLCFD